MVNSDIRHMRKRILQMSANAGEGHIPSALSILDIVHVLYDKVLQIDITNPHNPNRDIFILSKGHGSLALYTVLAARGLIADEWLDDFASYSSPLGGHPDRNKIPGVEASTGSLGHGLPIAVGAALGSKIHGNNQRVFVVVGDGECNEGTIWESALVANHHKLSNLCCIVDFNHSTDRALDVGNLREKFLSFGWKTHVIDGHHHEQIHQSVLSLDIQSPTAIIANTMKGHGISRMENKPEWHHRAPNMDELLDMLEEVK